MKKPCTPKPLRKSSEIAELAIALDISPSCHCKTQIACAAGLPGYPEKCPGKSKCDYCHPGVNSCEHIQEAGDFAEEFFGEDFYDEEKCLEKFLQILTLARPGDHCNPPLPTPSIAISHDARIALYTLRAQRGQVLFHPDDIREIDEIDSLMRKGKRELGLSTRKEIHDEQGDGSDS